MVVLSIQHMKIFLIDRIVEQRSLFKRTQQLVSAVTTWFAKGGENPDDKVLEQDPGTWIRDSSSITSRLYATAAALHGSAWLNWQ